MYLKKRRKKNSAIYSVKFYVGSTIQLQLFHISEAKIKMKKKNHMIGSKVMTTLRGKELDFATQKECLLPTRLSRLFKEAFAICYIYILAALTAFWRIQTNLLVFTLIQLHMVNTKYLGKHG